MSTGTPAPRTGFLYEDVYLQHDTGPGHPEKAARLTAIVEHLEDTGLDRQLRPLGPPEPIKPAWLTAVHEPAYVQRARNAWERGIRFLDSVDVPDESEDKS